MFIVHFKRLGLRERENKDSELHSFNLSSQYGGLNVFPRTCFNTKSAGHFSAVGTTWGKTFEINLFHRGMELKSAASSVFCVQFVEKSLYSDNFPQQSHKFTAQPIRKKGRFFNNHSYDTVLCKENLWGATQIGSRRKMWPHSDSLIWHLLLQTESVGPWGRRERRDRGVIESSSLDLIGKWDEIGSKFGWVSKAVAIYAALRPRCESECR